MEIEPINGIRKDSPAETAGFRKGDRIVKVNGESDFDPMRLPGSLLRQRRQTDDFRGRARRGGRQTADGVADRDPRRHSATDQVCPAGREPVDVAGLGLCYPVRTRVVAVRPDSPAAKAGLKPGDVINALDTAAGQADQLRRAVLLRGSAVSWAGTRPTEPSI